MQDEYKITCTACNDTGRKSTGGPCHPCAAKGRQPLRDAARRAIDQVFTRAYAAGRVPTETEVLEAVRQSLQPRVMYAAGFRDSSGAMCMCADPVPDPADVFQITPPHDPYARTAYIVKMTRNATGSVEDAARCEPIARWNGKRWAKKRHG